MATEVRGYRDDTARMYLIDVDGIIVSSITYATADKFKGLAPALIKAVHEWAKERDANDARLDALSAARRGARLRVRLRGRHQGDPPHVHPAAVGRLINGGAQS